MFKNQYDTDITTWSPAGRLYQVEYAMEAVKQGSATVGVKSATHVVLAALKRSPTAELSSYQEKIFLIDEHVGMSVTGLISDARVLARFMRTECMNHRYIVGSNFPVNRLAEMVGDKHQRNIQIASKRPFGVGLLIAGVDKRGPQLFQTSPSGEVHHCKATAMGSRSQSARTYLEKHFTSFENCNIDELTIHALKSLASTASEGVKLNTINTSIAIVGKDCPFVVLSDEEARKYLDNLVIQPEDRVMGDEDDDNDDAEPQDLAE
eukprot:Tbor_TRINITY_DN4163_c1_g1::TRINITY_DN4163_c1_g1_i1::g.26492::m.26492/K02725/PSMA1; 20S proteasome subunit alpha 6